LNRQPNSRHCFLCGVDNPIGLKLGFYDVGDGRVATRFTPQEQHQGYPGVMHGGIACALLDETIGRTLDQHQYWAMTIELNTRFHQPVPLGRPITVIGEIVRLRSRIMEGRGEIRLEDGSLAVSAEARYIRLSQEQTEAFQDELGFWQVIEGDEGEEAATEQALRRIDTE
jgi:uncharacterized protein (TIGR00369 family)